MNLRTHVLHYIIIAGNCFLADNNKNGFVRIERDYSGVAISSYLTSSTIECISMCTTNTECQAVTLHDFNNSCILYGRVTEYSLSQNGSQTSTNPLSYVLLQLTTCQTGWVNLDDSCYYLITIRRTWNEAKEYCDSVNSHLAVITTEREHNIIVDSFNSTADAGVWLGGFHNDSTGIWSWTTGEIWNYTVFGEDNSSPGTDRCLNIANRDADPSRVWRVRNCTTLLYSLCELNL